MPDEYEEPRPDLLQRLAAENAALREQVAELQNRLNTDQNTRVLSKAGFYEYIERNARSGDYLFFIDLDDFKSVNDSYGHHIGDQLLATVADALRRCVTNEGVVGRLAGDEFLVFVPFAVLTDALPFAERLRSSISTSHVTIGELSISRSASIGVTRIGEMVNAEHAVIDANAALRSAKSAGKNQASAFEGKKESLGQATPSIDDVRLGLRRGEIGYYVQPILDLLSMHAIGFEALLRWTRPNGEVLGPGYFLNQMTLAYNHETKPPLAEAHRTAEWAVHSQGKFIAFNISSAFLKRVAEKGSGWINEIVGDVPHDHIVFELVETIVDGEDSEIARVVANLRGNGVRIALDDFGSGHSTLHRLQSIPVDYVKIDRHFLAAASRSDRDLEIMRGMISIIHASGSEAIVEGIETQSQLDLCRQLGASFGQGFFLGQPAPLWSWGS